MRGEYVGQSGGDILISAFERESGRYYNSVYSLQARLRNPSTTVKDHLMPFEFIPLRSAFRLAHQRGCCLNADGRPSSWRCESAPLNVAGQKVAVNICYEDAWRRDHPCIARSHITGECNQRCVVRNSFAAEQHNQLSQMRALETGRMMLRATNTGVTSVIGVDGRVQAMLPQHEEGVLTAQVQGYEGSTPYVRWGNGRCWCWQG
ncbi:MAG: hypothetical protein IPH85_14525 [Ignavibacteria bacterium]|nr:hypothetical protein [Ignavibacteria bacterium]